MDVKSAWLSEINRNEPRPTIAKPGDKVRGESVYVDALRYRQCYTVAAVSRFGEHSERRMKRTSSVIAEIEAARWGLACAYLWEIPVVDLVTDCHSVIDHYKLVRNGGKARFAAAKRLERMARNYPGVVVLRWVPRSSNGKAHAAARTATTTRAAAKSFKVPVGELVLGSASQGRVAKN